MAYLSAIRLNDDFECSYLIIYSEEKVGTLKYRELAERIEIMQLQIRPDSQGKGLGKTVMESVLGWSKEKNKVIELAVLKTNPARLFYERLGFLIIGEDDYEFYMQFKN